MSPSQPRSGPYASRTSVGPVACGTVPCNEPRDGGQAKLRNVTSNRPPGGAAVTFETTTGAVERLRRFFSPRAVALIGATDNSQWSLFTYANLRRYSPEVTVHLVHPRAEIVHGQKVANSIPELAELGDPVDLAYVMVPTSAVLEVVEQVAAAGIRNLVILTAGFEEAGEQGVELAAKLERLATANDLMILGPNGNGFVNVAGGVAPYGLPIAPPLVAGPVGIVLQSGGLAAAVLAGAQARGIGLSLMVSTGNEALISATDIMRYLLDDEHTRVIAVFLESIRRPAEFREIAEFANRVGKPIVALKAGRSEQGARTALAHTGALAGDDRVIDAAFRQLGVIRVDSLEELLATAGYLGYHPDVKGRRIAAVTPSGGACDLLADRAESEGLELPEFPPGTTKELTDFLPPFSNPRNPLDVTGYVVVDPRLSLEALDIVAREAADHYDMILYATSFPRVEPKDLTPIEKRLDALASARERIPVPVILQTSIASDLPAHAQKMFHERGLFLLDGIELGTRAIGHGARYHEQRERFLQQRPAEAKPKTGRPAGATGVWPEHMVRPLLEAHGIPTAPAKLATTAEEAADIARSYGVPLAMKLAAPSLIHKSDVGGVRLEVDPSSAAGVFDEMMHASEAGQGVLVGPMRRGGIELIVGVVTDPSWGKVLSVGLGGIWVEVLRDVSLRLLPVEETEVARMLEELKAAPLLHGARGTRPADTGLLCQLIVRVAGLAESLPLDTLELNPLRVDGSEIEVLDALAVWTENREEGQTT
jgi:acyl-CoA synthetase (NDP forming)